LRKSANSHGETATNETFEWYTPPEIFEALGLEFDLDPASPSPEKVPWIPAAVHWTQYTNGLWHEWEGRVWLNPPYGSQLPEFMRRLVVHGNGMALVYARTETQWWQDSAPKADLVCFLRDRVAFIRDDGYQSRSQMGSALLAYGAECAAALASANLGWDVVTA